jgi:transposase
VARYGHKFKTRTVARLLPPESAPITTVSAESGVLVATLERWRADALSNARSRAGLDGGGPTAGGDCDGGDG